MRSAVGSGAVLGVSTGPADAEAEAEADPDDADAGDGAAGGGAALGPALPSAKCAGNTSVGAPGSVE